MTIHIPWTMAPLDARFNLRSQPTAESLHLQGVRMQHPCISVYIEYIVLLLCFSPLPSGVIEREKNTTLLPRPIEEC